MTVVAETTQFASSNLSEASYDPDTQELRITFNDGRTYSYSSVPASIYTGLQRAPSAGSYFHRQIKGRFAYEEE